MADGFLGRWSQRKQAVRAGQRLEEPATKAAPVVVDAALADDQLSPTGLTPQGLPAGAPPAPPPSLQDVQGLTAQSDFAPFVARDVTPEVRNAAMKKLFADPHYNVMDGLDIYIDDYSKPDPLPVAMLRQMVSAKFLNLFEDDDKDAPKDSLKDAATTPPPPLTAATPSTPNQSESPGPDHDHTDLQLQPNHAAGSQEPGRGTE